MTIVLALSFAEQYRKAQQVRAPAAAEKIEVQMGETTHSTSIQGKKGTYTLLFNTKTLTFSMSLDLHPHDVGAGYSGSAKTLQEAKKMAEAYVRKNGY